MAKVGIIIGIFLLCFFYLSKQTTYAARTPHCTDPDPGGVPVITSITTSATSVTLAWTPVPPPVTYYLLAYGLSKDNLGYGAPNIGDQNTTSYTINDLTPGQRYYFRIKAVNNCEPGDYSDTASIVVGQNAKSAVYKIPNLSLYKNELSTASAKSHKIGTTHALVASFCTTCLGFPLLVVQTITLALFLYLTHRVRGIKPIWGLIIPLIFFAIFMMSQKACSSNAFFCKYYIQLNILIFILAMIIHKFAFIHKKIEVFEDEFIQALKL
jgi:hypothetical protein